MAGKLKNLNGKQFFVNHGEKLGLVVIGLVVLFALATANWVPYNAKQPEDITRDVAAKKEHLTRLTVTPEAKQELGLVLADTDKPENLVKREVLDNWSAGQYDLRVVIAGSPNDKTIPLQEPNFAQHPIANLIASPGYVLLNLGPDVPPPVDPAAPTAPGATDPLIARTPAAPPVIPGFGIDADQFTNRAGLTPRAGGGSGMDYARSDMMYSDFMYTELGMDQGTSYAGQQLKGRGQPFVSVRGIIPLMEYIRDVQKALNITFAEAAQRFQLIDYHLERQTMNIDGTWPPDDQWDPVDRTTAEGILNEVEGIDIDPVYSELTDIATTMPLPSRITGVWGKNTASHPDIESFTLTPEEIEKEREYQFALLKQAQELEALAPRNEPQTLRKRGFFDVATTSKQLARQVAGESGVDVNYIEDDSGGLHNYAAASVNDDPKFKALLDELSKKGAGGKIDEKLREYIKLRVTAVGNVQLFRFIDFAVEPGKTYRYRARLEIENPNRLARVADAFDPSVVQGETRMSGWSNVTAPAQVQPDTYYFITDVESDRNKVSLDFLRFDPALGTFVSNLEPDPPEDQNRTNKNFKRLEVWYGEPVGGLLEVWLLDPAKMTFAKDSNLATDPHDPYSFNSGDLLVTALDDVKLSRADHPDLELPTTQNRDLQLVDALLVAKKNGQLALVDSITPAFIHEYVEQILLDQQNKDFRFLKQDKTKLLAEGMVCPCLDGLYSDDEGSGMMYGGSRVGRRKTSALKRKAVPAPRSRTP